jgi:hypothetical protein
MMTSMDRVEELRKAALPKRLAVGASHLGKFWKEGIRCKSGWREACSCGAEQTVFCRLKFKWIVMLKEYRNGYPDSLTGEEEYFLIEAMTPSMIEASGLTVLVEVPGALGPIKLGGPAASWNLFWELASMDEDRRPGFLTATFLIQEKL